MTDRRWTMLLSDINRIFGTHYYAWKNNEKRATMYQKPCRIVARGSMNSIVIEFHDGQRECVSRNSVRRLTLIPKEHNTK